MALREAKENRMRSVPPFIQIKREGPPEIGYVKSLEVAREDEAEKRRLARIPANSPFETKFCCYDCGAKIFGSSRAVSLPKVFVNKRTGDEHAIRFTRTTRAEDDDAAKAAKEAAAADPLLAQQPQEGVYTDDYFIDIGSNHTKHALCHAKGDPKVVNAFLQHVISNCTAVADVRKNVRAYDAPKRLRDTIFLSTISIHGRDFLWLQSIPANTSAYEMKFIRTVRRQDPQVSTSLEGECVRLCERIVFCVCVNVD